jgi:hypothetical protein
MPTLIRCLLLSWRGWIVMKSANGINGYSWLGEGVYNPFDVLQLFDEREFKNYWFETGTPGFLTIHTSQLYRLLVANNWEQL